MGQCHNDRHDGRGQCWRCLMARTVRIHLTDALDGQPADETVVFSLDGAGYEIDLSADHANDLRTALAGYITAGRRTGRGQIATATRVRAPRGAAPAGFDRQQNQAIRDWAKR